MYLASLTKCVAEVQKRRPELAGFRLEPVKLHVQFVLTHAVLSASSAHCEQVYEDRRGVRQRQSQLLPPRSLPAAWHSTIPNVRHDASWGTYEGTGGPSRLAPEMAEWRMTQVRLSREAREALDRLCLEHGITLTAYIEAIGQGTADGTVKPRPEVIRRAREIDRDRRSR